MRLSEISHPAITKAAFQSALRAVLGDMQKIDWIKSASDINTGLCGEFGTQVLAKFGLSFYERTPVLRMLNTKHFYDESDRDIDLARLHAMGEPVPPDLASHPRLAYELGLVHYWLCFEGRHYDAECIEGVDHFLDLPYFERVIERLRASLSRD